MCVLKDSEAGLSSKELAERYHMSRAWFRQSRFHPIELAFAKLKAFLRRGPATQLQSGEGIRGHRPRVNHPNGMRE
jgi:hypothetical protein